MAVAETPQQQLDWEARHRPRAALAAGIAGLGILGGPILQQYLLTGVPSMPLLDALQKLARPGTVLEQPASQVAVARFLQDRAAELIASHVLMAIGYFALAYAVTFLAAAVRARRPEFARWAFYLPIVGGVLFGMAWIAYGVARVMDADRILDGEGTIATVQDIGDTGLARASEVLLNPSALVLTVGLVLVSLNGMRTGLLTRFMGALGIVAAIFSALQYGSGLPLVLTFWIGGLALLLAGRRPGGDPPAWRTGRAEPWPSNRPAPPAQEEPEAPPEPRPQPERVPAGAHPATSKRKRKRRS